MRALAISLLLAVVVAVPARGEILEPVQPGDRLDISNYSGQIRIGVWEEDRIRIVADHGKGEKINLTRSGSVIRVRSASWDEASDSLEIAGGERAMLRMDWKSQPGLIVYDVSVPSWIPVKAAGATTSVSIDGLQAPVEITLFQGDVRVSGCHGALSIKTVAGETVIEESRGTVKVRGWQSSAIFRGVEGSLTVETTSGSLAFSDVRAGSLEAVTLAGGITYEGPLPATGTVSLATHAGGIELLLPAETDATVAVRTLRGTFGSDFPPGDRPGKSFRFQVGSGRSVLDLESFSGPIRIRRRQETR